MVVKGVRHGEVQQSDEEIERSNTVRQAAKGGAKPRLGGVKPVQERRPLLQETVIDKEV